MNLVIRMLCCVGLHDNVTHHNTIHNTPVCYSRCSHCHQVTASLMKHCGRWQPLNMRKIEAYQKKLELARSLGELFAVLLQGKK